MTLQVFLFVLMSMSSNVQRDLAVSYDLSVQCLQYARSLSSWFHLRVHSGLLLRPIYGTATTVRYLGHKKRERDEISLQRAAIYC